MIIKSKIFVSSAVIFSIIFLDQATKAFVLSSKIPFVCNRGIVFGMLSGFHNAWIPILVLAVFVYLFAREPSYSSSVSEKNKLSYSSSPLGREVTFKDIIVLKVSSHFVRTISYSLIVGGSISNILDRLTRGCVVDFINFGWWPAFNLADAAITVGVGILIFSFVKNPKNPGVSS